MSLLKHRFYCPYPGTSEAFVIWDAQNSTVPSTLPAVPLLLLHHLPFRFLFFLAIPPVSLHLAKGSKLLQPVRADPSGRPHFGAIYERMQNSVSDDH